nr:hypothetical protein [Tanacetum cinerariifolium]
MQLMIRTQVGDLSLHRTKYSSPALTQKVYANMIRVGKGCSKAETLLFKGMIVAPKAGEGAVEGATSINIVDVPGVVDEPSILSPITPTQLPPPSKDIPSTSQDIAKDVVVDVEVEENDKVEPAELQEVVKVVTTSKLITEVVTTTSATITAAAPQLTTAATPTLTTAPSAIIRRKRVVIRDPEETATPSTIIHTESKCKDKGKGILVEEPKPLKKQAQIKQDEAYARELEADLNKNIDWDEIDYFKGIKYDDIRLIFEKYFNSNVVFLEKTKEQMEEEDSRVLKRIMPNDEDDVYTEATPLARKVPVVDYEIYTENNKPYYKIIRADGSPQLFLIFLSLLRNFDREDLEVLWELVKERFASSKSKNFSADFLLTTLTYIFEKPDVQAQVWKNQRTVHDLAK